MTEKQRTRTDRYHINWHEADFRGNATLTALCNLLQESAWRHAEHMGFGYEDALRLNQFWIVLRWFIKIERYPKWRENILIETWPRLPERLFALRDYTITDQQGRQFGAATSTWMLLDARTRRPQKLELVDGFLHLTSNRSALGENAQKILVPEDVKFNTSLETHYSDVDHNGHVNNARYVEWCMNLYPVSFHKKYMVSKFRINFLHECRFDETVDLLLKKDTETDHIIIGRRKTDGVHIFASRIGWKGIA